MIISICDQCELVRIDQLFEINYSDCSKLIMKPKMKQTKFRNVKCRNVDCTFGNKKLNFDFNFENYVIFQMQ